jgi:3-deoxy-manno-octulosonate cytidylyltransferase (CMP-KDO synthetase)
MWNKCRVACVIPARLQSSRFPRKILTNLSGKPLVEWVWAAAKKVDIFDEVVFAIDAEETARVIESFGGRYIMTSSSCLSGTDRLVELQKSGAIKADVWVNWQADGPFISRDAICDLLQSCDCDHADVWTLKKQISSDEDVLSADVSKVVCDARGRAMYFSRSCIPFYRRMIPGKEKIYFKHVGLYAYSDSGLKKISELPPSDLEVIEQLEQLRFIYNGLWVQVHETQHETLEIDLPEHLAKAEEVVARKNRVL